MSACACYCKAVDGSMRLRQCKRQCAGAADVDAGPAGGAPLLGQQLALLEARSGGGRLDAACAAAERVLALLASAGDAQPAGSAPAGQAGIPVPAQVGIPVPDLAGIPVLSQCTVGVGASPTA
jgi:hypothetical protein